MLGKIRRIGRGLVHVIAAHTKQVNKLFCDVKPECAFLNVLQKITGLGILVCGGEGFGVSEGERKVAVLRVARRLARESEGADTADTPKPRILTNAPTRLPGRRLAAIKDGRNRTAGLSRRLARESEGADTADTPKPRILTNAPTRLPGRRLAAIKDGRNRTAGLSRRLARESEGADTADTPKSRILTNAPTRLPGRRLRCRLRPGSGRHDNCDVGFKSHAFISGGYFGIST